MLKNLKEEDFYELQNIAYDRLEPENISGFFWASFILCAVLMSIIAAGGYIDRDSAMYSYDWIPIINIFLVILGVHLIYTING